MRLRGTGHAGGVVMGTIALLRMENGIPALSEKMQESLADQFKKGARESLDIVLAASGLEYAHGVILPGARIVGIIAEEPEPLQFAPRVPTVTGISGLMDRAEDGLLAIVDGTAGSVIIDPEPTSIAFYQSEAERIAPRRRIFLDSADMPARTPDGRIITVLARVTTIEDIVEAAANGADGLYIPEEARVVPADGTESDQFGALLEIVHRAPGKPVIIVGNLNSLSGKALLQAAVRMELTLALPLDLPAEILADTRQYLEDLRAELYSQGTDFREITFAGILQYPDELEEEKAERLSRVIAEPGDTGWRNEAVQAWLQLVVFSASAYMVPVLAVQKSWDPRERDAVLRIGVAGITLEPSEVQEAKAAIKGD